MPRPHVVAVLAMSLDGKIATAERDDAAFSSRADRRHLNSLRARADAIVAGAGTLRATDQSLRVTPKSLLGSRPEPARAVVSRLCLLSPDLKVFGPGPRTLVFTTTAASPGARKALEGRAEMHVTSGSAVSAREIVDVLGRSGAGRIQVEGGGELVWTFAAEDLLDEMHLTVCPVLIGGNTAPTPAGGDGFPPDLLRKARLESCRRDGDEVFLSWSFPRP
jgi:5-amino-6-(5-phosphoribosylamino)uracil reductase